MVVNEIHGNVLMRMLSVTYNDINFVDMGEI